MSDPLWLRSAALTASLAGLSPDEAARGFAPLEGDAIARRVRRPVEAQDPLEVARALAAERAAWGRSDVDTHARVRRGARWLAVFVRTLRPDERARWVRGFDAETIAAMREFARTASPGSDADARQFHTLVARTAEAIGRVPTAVEIGGVIDGFGGDDRAVSPWIAAVSRAMRIAAQTPSAAVLAWCAGEGNA